VLITKDEDVEDGERENRLTPKLTMADARRTKTRKRREENQIHSTDYSLSV
jgi:hypothetical protein